MFTLKSSNNRGQFWPVLPAMLILAIFSFSSLSAQQNSFFIGATGGANLSKFKYTNDLAELYPASSGIPGLNAGVSLGFQIQNFTLSSGIQYMQKGSHYETENFQDELGTGFFSAKERLHYISVPVLIGYRQPLGDNFGLMLAMGPSFNMGLGGKIEESMEYYGSEDITKEHYTVKYGTGVNDDYRKVQMGFQFSPGFYVDLNKRSKVTVNLTWDSAVGDSFNPRYKQANTFFDDYRGNQYNKSTILSIGYEYHFNFSDKY